MNSTNGLIRIAAAALCGLALTACDSIKDVRSEPSTSLPKQRVVLEGKVYGLGIRRSIRLQNGPATDAAARLIQGNLGEPIGPDGRETRFSFGSLEDGTDYNIIITPGLAPFGKICEVENGVGTLRYDANDALKGAPRDIAVVCTDDPNVQRYDIRVATPEPFRSSPGAKVTLMTEEGLYEADPADNTVDGDPDFVTFTDKLITLPAAGVLPFQNIIKAYTETGSTASLKLVNRCAVANHTFPSPAGTGADRTDVAVGACTFTVGGNEASGAVRYSRPIGVAADPAMGAGGVVLELKYPNGDPVPSTTGPTTEVTLSAFNSNFVFPTSVTSGAECPAPVAGEAPIPCEVRGFYEVVVKQHPAGQRCIVASSTVGQTGPMLPGNPTAPIAIGAVAPANVANGIPNWAGAANLYLYDESVGTGTFPNSPANYTALRVWCRDLPTNLPANQLTGTYQVTSQEFRSGGTTPEAETVTSTATWSPTYQARRTYSHMLTLFADGTFLFGAHTSSDAVNTTSITNNHTEQGFYEYVPTSTAGDANNTVGGTKIRFTVHVDSNTPTAATTAVIDLPLGISTSEGSRTVGTGATGLRHHVLTNVVLGTVTSPLGPTLKTLQGDFGRDATPAPAATATKRRMIFVEPVSLPGQITGNWISQDHLRFWSYNFDSTFVYHSGVTGFPNLQDTCLKIENYAAPSGLIIPSPGGGGVYCNPVGSAFQSNLSQLAHSPPPLLQARLPGWQGWLPGTELGGGSTARSPSPVHYQIAPVASFPTVADPEIFPGVTPTSLSWCTTEVMGIRGTQNGELVESRKPLYFCRY